jgi:predicted O-methyltransferase YrrM
MTMSYLEGLLEQAREKRLGWEGSADKAELECLSRLASDRAIRTIGEIGFNLGFSSYTFLSSNHKAKVVSFDIAKYWYVSDAKAYIDRTFPDRHTLVVGDSLKTVPEFRRENPDIAFDLIFIDGDHSYDAVKADFLAYSPLVRAGGLVALHDIVPDHRARYGVETSKSSGGVPLFWHELQKSHRTEELVEDPDQDGYGIGLVQM